MSTAVLAPPPAAPSPAAPSGGPDRARWAGRAATVLVTALLLALALWWGLLTAQGGRLFMVETPSMARTAPVGTLVVTERVDPTALRVGDVITFRPTATSRVYTHRIIEITPAGLRTKGDLNDAADGWVVPTDNVVGRARHLWFGLGWVLRMAPWFVGGALLTAAIRHRVRLRHKAPVAIVGLSLALSVALILVRPLVRAETIGFVPTGPASVKISAVGTGLLPVRATSLDDRYVDLVPGQLGWVDTAKADEHGRYQLLPTLHLPWWGTGLMGLFCALPLLASLVVRDPDDPDEPALAEADPDAPAPEPDAPEAAARGEHEEPAPDLDHPEAPTTQAAPRPEDTR